MALFKTIRPFFEAILFFEAMWPFLRRPEHDRLPPRLPHVPRCPPPSLPHNTHDSTPSLPYSMTVGRVSKQIIWTMDNEETVNAGRCVCEITSTRPFGSHHVRLLCPSFLRRKSSRKIITGDVLSCVVPGVRYGLLFGRYGPLWAEHDAPPPVSLASLDAPYPLIHRFASPASWRSPDAPPTHFYV